MPDISVIVPVYKVEKYLKSCVNSIQNQTFRDLEIVLVDDGSPDHCGEICDRLAAEDSRIKVIHQVNQGLSCARNAGLGAATGDYICFVDSDDLLAPDYCRELLSLLREHDGDFSFCAVHRFDDGTIPAPGQSTQTPVIVSNSDYLRLQLEKKTEFGVWNKLFRREALDHIRFAPHRLNEDVIFSADMLRMLRRGGVGTPQALYYYRQRQGSIVAIQSVKASPDRVYAGEYLLRVVKDCCPALTDLALRYALAYPWMFVDPVYVHGSFRENIDYLNTVQRFLRKYISEYEEREIFSDIQTGRMKLYAQSKWRYALNAYARLFRVYLCHLIGKDAYQDGHGI